MGFIATLNTVARHVNGTKVILHGIIILDETFAFRTEREHVIVERLIGFVTIIRNVSVELAMVVRSYLKVPILLHDTANDKDNVVVSKVNKIVRKDVPIFGWVVGYSPNVNPCITHVMGYMPITHFPILIA